MTYNTDEEWDAAVLEAFDYHPTAEEAARDQAGAEGRMVAILEAERYTDLELPSRRLRFGMGLTSKVRDQVDMVMIEQHKGDSRTTEEYMPKLAGVQLPTFDKHNPEHSRGVFVVFANKPTVAHSMRFDRVEDLLARTPQRTDCAWLGLNVFCANYTRDYWCFSRGQYVVVFPTCHECRDWHLCGAPDMDLWSKFQNWSRKVRRSR